jgi:hypothetical protein
MTRQWLNCPGTEAHAARLEHIKTLGTVGEVKQYLKEVREQCGRFWGDYLEDEVAALLKARKAAA